MAGQSNADYLSQAVDGFASRVGEFADGIAGRLGGQPMSGTQLSKDEAVQRWNFSPLGSTDQADAAYHQLVMQGTPPGQALNQVYPMRSMLYQSADLQDAISTAKQIQGWAADAAGTEPAPSAFDGSSLHAQFDLQKLASMQQQATPVAQPAAPVPQLPPQLGPIPAPGPGPVS
jgi:hypothetical protein